jgi:biotin carboxyl carrier protein
MKYRVQVDGGEHEVVVDGDTITVDGQVVRAHLESLPGTPLHLLTVGGATHRLQMRRSAEKGLYDVSLSGYRLSVEALDERARAIRALSGASARAAGPAHLVAPMPGLIVRVVVQEGDQVRAGQGLVVMEAMKMENELRAPRNARVHRVAVAAGSVVEKGTVLLELESE